MRKNHALAKIQAGKIAVGPVLVYASPDMAEQAAHLGFDWAWLDWQHGEWTESSLNDALARFLAVDTTPIVRVKGHDPGVINHVLDMGAMGVMVPMVQNAAQARAVAQAVYYPPKGQRSGGGTRLSLIAGGNIADYYALANDQMILVVQVETEEAVRNVREIMSVPGVDVALIGPGDLMIDVKANGHDEAYHAKLVLEVAEAARETGTVAGCYCADLETAQQRAEQGFHFIGQGGVGAAMNGYLQELLDLSRTW